MWRRLAAAAFVIAIPVVMSQAPTSPGAGPVIVLETAKGNVEIETYPEEAPKTVAQIVRLVKDGFYDGQRFHRAEPGFLVQVGDPASRDLTKREWWGRGGSGTAIGVAEMTKKRTHVRGAVGIGYPGSDPKRADSLLYIVLEPQPQLDAKYTIFGKVVSGMEVVDRIQRDDVLRKVSLRE